MERERNIPMWDVEPIVMAPSLFSQFKKLARVELKDGRREILGGHPKYGHLIWVSNCLAATVDELMLAIALRPRDREDYYTMKRRLTEDMKRLADRRGTTGEQQVWSRRVQEVMANSDEIKREYEAYKALLEGTTRASEEEKHEE